MVTISKKALFPIFVVLLSMMFHFYYLGTLTMSTQIPSWIDDATLTIMIASSALSWYVNKRKQID